MSDALCIDCHHRKAEICAYCNQKRLREGGPPPSPRPSPPGKAEELQAALEQVANKLNECAAQRSSLRGDLRDALRRADYLEEKLKERDAQIAALKRQLEAE